MFSFNLWENFRKLFWNNLSNESKEKIMEVALFVIQQFLKKFFDKLNKQGDQQQSDL